ncbi:MAG: serine hydrolase [Acidobacteria bacterium]|nr:serine hydrolase [Acidobacteriota bacterium]
MIRERLIRAVVMITLAAATTIGLAAQQPASVSAAPPPQFPNADRIAKLTGALPGIDQLFRQFATRNRVPGIAWGILIDGKLVHSGSAGYRDVASKAPVDAETVFRIASMTKSFTAISILKLRDEGKLSLDDPAERYVPQLGALKYPTADSPRITIRHLLSHAEGFPEDNPWGDRQLAVTDDQMVEMLQRGIPFSNPPGLAYEYSNFGFAILGRIVSRVSGMPYRDYVQRNILTPLGMTATTLDSARVPADRMAHGYRLEDGQWKDEPSLPDGAFGAMGGMLTSTTDLARYVGFLMSAWPPRDDADTGPLRRSSVREMQQVWRPSPATVTRDQVDAPLRLNTGGYAFGLRVWQSCDQRHLVAHSGGLPGFGSHMRWLPEHGVAIIAMGNLTYTSWGRVADDVVDLLAATGGLQPRAPQPSPALLAAKSAVSTLITGWDDNLAESIAADNLFLDDSKERRRAQVDQLRVRHGACRPDAAFDVENALRGVWKMTCDRGWLRVGITLAPTMPPRVQSLSMASIMPLAGRLSDVAVRVVSMVGHPDEAALGSMLGPGMDVRAVAARLTAASAWGACAIGDVLDGDGSSTAGVRLSCAHGPLVLRLSLNEQTGRITRLSLAPAGDVTCVP